MLKSDAPFPEEHRGKIEDMYKAVRGLTISRLPELKDRGGFDDLKEAVHYVYQELMDSADCSNEEDAENCKHSYLVKCSLIVQLGMGSYEGLLQLCNMLFDVTTFVDILHLIFTMS